MMTTFVLGCFNLSKFSSIVALFPWPVSLLSEPELVNKSSQVKFLAHSFQPIL
jgi:hypothetical protein